MFNGTIATSTQDVNQRRAKRKFANDEEKRKGLLDNVNIYKQKINNELKQMVDFLSKRGYPIPSRSQPKIIRAMFDALKKTCAENDRLNAELREVYAQQAKYQSHDVEPITPWYNEIPPPVVPVATSSQMVPPVIDFDEHLFDNHLIQDGHTIFDDFPESAHLHEFEEPHPYAPPRGSSSDGNEQVSSGFDFDSLLYDPTFTFLEDIEAMIAPQIEQVQQSVQQLDPNTLSFIRFVNPVVQQPYDTWEVAEYRTTNGEIIHHRMKIEGKQKPLTKNKKDQMSPKNRRPKKKVKMDSPINENETMCI